MSQTSNHESTSEAMPDFLRLPPELENATTEELANRYIHLSEIKLAGEIRAGRHPTGYNHPSDVEPDPTVREVLNFGLAALVREMGAVMHELYKRPGGAAALLR